MHFLISNYFSFTFFLSSDHILFIVIYIFVSFLLAFHFTWIFFLFFFITFLLFLFIYKYLHSVFIPLCLTAFFRLSLFLYARFPITYISTRSPIIISYFANKHATYSCVNRNSKTSCGNVPSGTLEYRYEWTNTMFEQNQ